MPDQFDDLFASLRSETLPQVRPPGTASARETVRRRRTKRRIAATTSAVALAGVVLTATVLPRYLTSDHGSSNAADSSASPAISQADAGPSGQTTTNAKRALNLLLAEGLQARAMTTERAAVTTTQQLTGGDYQMRVACVGPGSVVLTVTDRSAGSRVTEEKIACTSTDPTSYPSFIPVTVSEPTDLEIAVAADPEARNTAGFAYAVTPIG